MRSAAATLVFLAASVAPAAAFDCSKATTATEKAICADPGAKAADERMSSAFAALRDRLKGTPGEQTLKEGQRAWLRHRDSFCQAEAECLASEALGRAETIEQTPEGAAPFMLWQDMKPGVYRVSISAPRFFDRAIPGAAAYEDWLERLIADSPYGKPADKDMMDAFALDHSVDVTIASRTPRLFSAVAAIYAFSGGAHGSGVTEALNVDLATGREIDMAQAIGQSGLERLERECANQIAKEKAGRLDDLSVETAAQEMAALYPDAIAEHVADSGRWTFEAEEGVVTFDSYAIGAYAEGVYECRFSRAQIAGVAADPELFVR